MFDHELTMTDVLNDPLIRQMMHADGVSLDHLRRLLHEAQARPSAKSAKRS